MAIRVLLEHRIDKIANDSPAQQKETVNHVKVLLAAKLERKLEPEDADVAVLAAKALKETGDTELTLEACRSFAELIKKADSDQLSKALKNIEKIIRRVQGNDQD